MTTPLDIEATRIGFRTMYRPDLTEEQKLALWAAVAPIIGDPACMAPPPEEEA